MQNLNSGRATGLNLQAIGVFCEVVQQRSFSKGAERVGVSQSAASQQIAHLEQVLGFKLIDRSYRPLQVTDEGELYYKGCLQILGEHNRVLDSISRKRKSTAGQVRVFSIYSIGLHTLNEIVRNYMQENPGSTVHLEYYHPRKVYEAIRNDEAEVGVISYPRRGRHIEVLPWVDEEMVLACPPGHPLSASKRIDVSKLAGANFVGFDKELTIRKEIDKFFRGREIGVNILSEFDNIETIKQALDISDAVSILPRSGIEREVERGIITEVHLDNFDLVRPVGLIYRSKRELSATAGEFMRFLMSSGSVQGRPPA
jgi:DNA-binding transcriptional LysR family regulator